MSSVWSKAIEDFEIFLQKAGLQFVCREESAVFGNRLLEYRDAELSVRVVSDRGIWTVEVADIITRPTKWYDAGLIRGLFDQAEDALSLDAQVQTVQAYWPAIAHSFQPSESMRTHERLASLGEERVRRLFPGLRRQTI